MSHHLRRIYDLERQLPERNFAKDHSFEEWLVQQRATSIEGCPHTDIELQKVCERCGYREPVGDAPDLSQLARTAAEKIAADINGGEREDLSYPSQLSALLDDPSVANEKAFAVYMAVFIEEVLAGSNLYESGSIYDAPQVKEIARGLADYFGNEWPSGNLYDAVIDFADSCTIKGYEQAKKDAAKVAEDKNNLNMIGGSTGNAIGTAQIIAKEIRALTPAKSEG